MKVLVVDDERGIRVALTRALTQRGHTVITAATAEAAVTCLTVDRPDVALVDVQLGPGMTGVELAARLPRGLPIILMSGVYSSSEIHELEDAQTQRINAVPIALGKPVDLEILERALVEALARRKPW